MANKINVKLILELLQPPMSQRQIEETRHISSKSITAVCRRAAELGVSYADLADKSDDEVYLLFFPDKFQKETVYAPINYEYVHGELKKDGRHAQAAVARVQGRCERGRFCRILQVL
ncbi:hypothetical protein [Ruminococcus flavefaciens]|uniref:hypothetical protein n=1 Tax=Ruminococcus flavefaciens TaxID=1265 RepID=UPI001FA7C717|nr:hypothetical protein [Ruminococcus flavefaciens]